ncbi:MAG: glycosyl hydrolase family 28-related protein [Minisyncoccia bacterium]
MKKKTAFLLALLFYASLLPWRAETACVQYYDQCAANVTGDNAGRLKDMSIGSASYTDNGYFQDIITKGPYVDVRAHGTALTQAPIQLAIDNANSSTGADIFVPAGTYVLAANIGIIGKNNLTLRGAGMGRTILDGSAAYITKLYMGSSSTWGILTIEGASDGASYSDNIVIRDMTIINSTTDNGSLLKKHTFFGSTKHIKFINVRFVNSNYEGLYHHGSLDPSVDDVEAKGCEFDGLGVGGTAWGAGLSSFNLNSANTRNAKVHHNYFANGGGGVTISGDGADVSRNFFYRMLYNAVQVEGSPSATASRSIGGINVSHNIAYQTGYGAAEDTQRRVFSWFGSPGPYTDNTQDSAPVFESNQVIDSYGGTTGPLNAFYGEGNIKLVNNYVSGLYGTATNSAFIAVLVSSVHPEHLHTYIIEGNTLAKSLDGAFWATGIGLTGNDNTWAHLGGNRVLGMAGSATIAAGLNATPDNTSGPHVSLNGDIFTSQIAASRNYSGMSIEGYDNVPIFGSNDTTIRTAFTETIATTFPALADNSATPSVAGGTVFRIQNSAATTISNLTGGVTGQKITLVCADNTTDFTDAAGLDISAAFTCTLRDVIVFLKDATGWMEVSRSAN